MIKQNLFKVIFCIIVVCCHIYVESDNSVSSESDENPDINEVLDSDEDGRDDEEERNNTDNNTSTNIDMGSENVIRSREGKNQVLDIKSSDKHVPDNSDQNFYANTTAFRKCTVRSIQSAEKISEEVECNSTLLNHPFSVSIQRKGSHYASGALLNNQTVLTAAAEFYNVRESIKLYKVRLGSVNCKKGGRLVHIKSINIHPSYERGNPAYDVAVLKLAEQVNLTEYIRPVPMSNVTQKVISAKFMTTYWPRLIINGRALPKSAKERTKHHSMRISTQRLIPWKICRTLVDSTEMMLDLNSLCLKPIKTHHSLCMPDPGAPVVAEDGLWGITSGWTSKNCKTSSSPTIFTRTSLKPIRKWLLEFL